MLNLEDKNININIIFKQLKIEDQDFKNDIVAYAIKNTCKDLNCEFLLKIFPFLNRYFEIITIKNHMNLPINRLFFCLGYIFSKSVFIKKRLHFLLTDEFKEKKISSLIESEYFCKYVLDINTILLMISANLLKSQFGGLEIKYLCLITFINYLRVAYPKILDYYQINEAMNSTFSFDDKTTRQLNMLINKDSSRKKVLLKLTLTPNFVFTEKDFFEKLQVNDVLKEKSVINDGKNDSILSSNWIDHKELLIERFTQDLINDLAL